MSAETWTADNCYLLEYKGRIESGEIIAGQELYMELCNLAEDLKNTDLYFYDRTAALLRFDFMEHCVRLTKSPFYNQPMRLMLWQKAFIETLYSFKLAGEQTRNGDPVDRFKSALLLIGRKNGKALALDTRIPTPNGDKTMADIKPGDFVYNENGYPVEVLATSEIFKDRTCYEFTFEDGEKIICDANHKWTVQTKDARRRENYTPKTGRKSGAKHPLENGALLTMQAFEMVEDYKRQRRDGKGMEYKYRVPLAKPIEYPKKKLFSPYVLGLWLGDGDKNDNRIAVGVDDLETLLKELKKEGVHVQSVKMFSGKYEVRIGETRSHKTDTRDAFRALGVWKNKHIPEEYFTASIEQRRDLLCGLMDTDGTCSKAGQCEFTQKSERIIKDFSRLLTSLGIKHTIKDNVTTCNGRIFKSFVVRFWTTKSFSCFRYPRKHERLKDQLASRMLYKSIVDIKEVAKRDTKCICVNSKTGLFLCGERNTVTHNSETCSGLANAEFIAGNEGADIVCSSNDDAQASIVYDAIDTMRALYDPNSVDTKRNQRFILNKATNTKIFKLSDRTRNKEGRNIDWAILDEAHEMKNNVIAKSIEQSQSVKDNPKFIKITTEGFVVGGYLDEELKGARAIIYGEDTSISGRRKLPWLYTQDSETEIFTNPRSWQKSNPTIGVIKRFDYLEEQVDLAKKSKADRIFVLSKDFNYKQNGAQSWLNVEDYDYGATFDIEDLRGAFCLGHVDLAETTDLVCAKALVIRPGDATKYILTQYFIPENKLQPENDDHTAGAHYKEWVEKGFITLNEGNEADLANVAAWFYKLYKEHGIKLYKCGYDQKFAKEWLAAMEDYGWTKAAGDVEMILQNAQTLSNAINLCEADFKSRLINYNDNPVDKWNLSNACLKLSEQRQALIIKTENAKKIDGAVTLASLYEMWRRYRSDLKKLTGG